VIYPRSSETLAIGYNWTMTARSARRPRPWWLLLPLFALVAVTTGAGAQVANPWTERRVLVIAHAGGENESPHTTPFGYKRAVAHGSEVLEGDLRMTGDDVLIVHHDADVNATTDGTGLVADKTYAELYALDHGYKFTPYQWSCGNCPVEDYIYRGVRTGAVPPPAGFTPEDFTIPTARYLFETFPAHYLDLEIKDVWPASKPAADELIALIDEFDALDRTIIVSFDQPTMDYVNQQLPAANTSPGVAGMTTWFLDPAARLPDDEIVQVPPSFSGITVVTPEFVERAHDEGLAVWVWMDGSGQETYAFYTELIEMGVDGLLVSRPSVARQAVDDAGATWVPPTAPPTTSTTTTSTTAPGSGPSDPDPGPATGTPLGLVTPTAPAAVAVPFRPSFTG
jgi:glycerophosphoryl diester phosphodiesterase